MEKSLLEPPPLKKIQQILYPSFFSEQGLAQDILRLTRAERDVPLETFISLNDFFLKQERVLKEKWNNFLGTNSLKAALYSPEHLMGDQDLFELPSKLPQEAENVFMRFQNVLTQVDILEKEVRDTNDLDVEKKKMILLSLNNVKAFSNDYKTRVLNICQNINQKRIQGQNIDQDQRELSFLLERKAIMFGELFPKGATAYRIPRSIARHILSLQNDGTPKPKDPNLSANHRVSSLPAQEKPQVFFKLDGMPNLQPGKEAMLSSLYQLLNIPVPCTSLLVITGISENDSNFYIVQASEAVLGESPKTDISWQEHIKTNAKDFASFCKQVLGAILTNPIDGRPANFIYNKDNHGLVSIDNDEVFYDENFTTKSLLFCIQAMDEPIPRSLSTFLTTLDHQLLLLTWLDQLNQKNQEYHYLESVLCYENARQNFQKQNPNEDSRLIQDLLQKEPIKFCGLSKPFLESLSLPITIQNSLFNSLQTNLSKIIKALKDNCNHTSQKLLEKVSPYLGDYYRTVRNEFPNDPLEAISHIWKNPQKFSQNSDINYLPDELFLSHYTVLKESRTLSTYVEKHGAMRKKNIFQSEMALKELFCLIKVGLATTFQKPGEIVYFWYKGRSLIQDKVMIEQWDDLFFLLQDPEFQWLLSLEKHFIRGWKNPDSEYPKELSDIKGAFLGKRSLSDAMMGVIFDNNSGAFQKDQNLKGRLDVTKFPPKNPVFYLKKSPEIPGYEYAATLFMRLLALEGIPFSELLLFNDHKKALYPVLLTQAVRGDTLDKIWHNDQNLTSLDPHHTYLLILCSMLLNPEDGKGDNYILSPDKKRIIPIDNDHSFLPGVIEESKGWFLFKNVYTELQSKTVLYCLHEMNKPIPESVIQIFTELDIDEFLHNWMNKLVIVNDRYQNLPPQNLFRSEGDTVTIFRMPFPEESIKNLYNKFYQMKRLLSQEGPITPFEVLIRLESYVGNLYKKVFHKEPTVFGRFDKITKPLYQTDNKGYPISRLNSLQIIKILHIPKSELINKNFMCELGPSEAEEFLQNCRENMKQREIYYQRVIRGEEELKKTDLSNFSEGRERRALDLAFKNSQEAVALNNSNLLDGKILSKIFDSFSSNMGTEIRLLDLRGTKKLDSFSILLISAYFPNIEFLHLGNHPELESAVFLEENFKNLKRLVIGDCEKLACLVIESPLLDVLQIKKNKNLIHVVLSTPNLTYFDFTESQTTQIHMLSKMGNLQVAMPSLIHFQKSMAQAIDVNVIRHEINETIFQIMKEIALQKSLVSKKKLLLRKNKMPERMWNFLMFALKYSAFSKLSHEVQVLPTVTDLLTMKEEDLEKEGRETLEGMIIEAFHKNEKNL